MGIPARSESHRDDNVGEPWVWSGFISDGQARLTRHSSITSLWKSGRRPATEPWIWVWSV